MKPKKAQPDELRLHYRVVLIILMRRFAPYRKWIFVSRRRSIAGYVTEPTYKKTLLRGCKATIRISEYINQNF